MTKQSASAYEVVLQQQMQGVMMVGTLQGHRDWHTGLCSCCQDCKTLLFTWFAFHVPCVT
ncbi:hypothetical protein DPMN_100125 [Dreissena polymorpha]|uniref:Uncharacterized protein n=1 Tax=Dreissena polymorpha TaxID=45954 RepID=A0A9D4LIK7_DREPO|nr:hypothetical protein DPMN_100125 [Dreissena polymorpha]